MITSVGYNKIGSNVLTFLHWKRYCISRTYISGVSKDLWVPCNGVRMPTQTNRVITREEEVCKSLQDLLQKCARERSIIHGKSCHAQIIHLGLQSDTLTSNMLINMYSKCGLVHIARIVFGEMPQRSLVSWNTMIGSYTQNGKEQEGLELFLQFRKEGSPFSEFTISSVLCACAAKFSLSECKQLHGLAIKADMDSNIFVSTALLDVYAKCGLPKDASFVFEFMPERSEVTWSSILAGYVQNELYEEGLALFRRALRSGLKPDQFMISSLICACSGLAALIEGNQVNAMLSKTGFGSNMYIISSLIDMYARCGSILEAYNVFRGVEEKRDVVLWNSMITGLSKHARSHEVMILFEKMQQMGIYPDDISYISVLSACSHMGLVKEGRKYFHLMVKAHHLSPNVLHYACLVDVLGRAGKITEAHEVIKEMPFHATASMWGSLLASCRNHGKLDLAEVAANRLFEIEPNNAGNYILLSNVYAANKKWEEVAKARKLIKESEVKKERGKSWIEVKGKVHVFTVGERNHEMIFEIYAELDGLVREVRKMGYKVGIEHDLHDVEESQKRELLRHHSEKLALALGLICLPDKAPIRIMKNLRICGDCHSFMKFVSGLTKRCIIVRDTNRFHQFENGCCSCGDFW